MFKQILLNPFKSFFENFVWGLSIFKKPLAPHCRQLFIFFFFFFFEFVPLFRYEMKILYTHGKIEKKANNNKQV